MPVSIMREARRALALLAALLLIAGPGSLHVHAGPVADEQHTSAHQHHHHHGDGIAHGHGDADHDDPAPAGDDTPDGDGDGDGELHLHPCADSTICMPMTMTLPSMLDVAALRVHPMIMATRESVPIEVDLPPAERT